MGKTRITAKQKSARRRNIKVAQAAKRKGGGVKYNKKKLMNRLMNMKGGAGRHGFRGHQ